MNSVSDFRCSNFYKKQQAPANVLSFSGSAQFSFASSMAVLEVIGVLQRVGSWLGPRNKSTLDVLESV